MGGLPMSQFQRAYLEVESGGRIDCMFNPATLSFAIANSWIANPVPGRQSPNLQFAGGAPGQFSLQLLFDTTHQGESVTTHTDKITSLMAIDEKLAGYDAKLNNGRPPWVKFHWGVHLHSFKAVVTSANVSYTYFSQEGVPLRADVDMTLEQFEQDGDWGPQNPTSGTPKPNRSHQVQVGDTLDRIAARYYGDATKWRDIARLNGIADPLDLRPGEVLAIPESAG